MLRYLIHVLGDIHQPLHASALFNEVFKDGDQGGNLFLIKYNSEIGNLHKLFDSGIDRLNNNITRVFISITQPLDNQGDAYLKGFAEELLKEFPREVLDELKNKDIQNWIEESHDISQKFVYPEITYLSYPSYDYIKKGYEIIRRRIVLGGYRLAEIVKSINSSYKKAKEVHEEDKLFLSQQVN